MILYFQKKYGKFKVNDMCAEHPLTDRDKVIFGKTKMPLYHRSKTKELKKKRILADKMKINKPKIEK